MKGPHTAERGGKNLSVLKCKRTDSKAEYVNIANQIYMETIVFFNAIVQPVRQTAGGAGGKTGRGSYGQLREGKQNFPSDEQRKSLRKGHLLEAQASLSALDVRLTHCYIIMWQNPEGCFTTASGRVLKAEEAKRNWIIWPKTWGRRSTSWTERSGRSWRATESGSKYFWVCL